jgi:hypothetical protein
MRTRAYGESITPYSENVPAKKRHGCARVFIGVRTRAYGESIKNVMPEEFFIIE